MSGGRVSRVSRVPCQALGLGGGRVAPRGANLQRLRQRVRQRPPRPRAQHAGPRGFALELHAGQVRALPRHAAVQRAREAGLHADPGQHPAAHTQRVR